MLTRTANLRPDNSPRPMFDNDLLCNQQAGLSHIADLIRGIRASGFIDKGDDM